MITYLARFARKVRIFLGIIFQLSFLNWNFFVQQNQEKNVKSHASAEDFQDFTERLMRAMLLSYIFDTKWVTHVCSVKKGVEKIEETQDEMTLH